MSSASLLVVGALALWAIFRWSPRAGIDQNCQALLRLRPQLILGIGLAAQVVVASLTSPKPVSDFAAYLHLAQQLASGATYQHEERLAFWPPGLPLYLMPFVALFGKSHVAVILANAALFVIGGLGLWYLSERLVSGASSRIVLVLYCFWPSRLLSSGLASKENLTFAMVTCCLALCLAALRAAQGRSSARASIVTGALPAGAAMGLAALAQPGLLLLALALPIGLRSWLTRQSALVFIISFAAGYILTVGPWHVRNFTVFDGQFYGISTNGGSVIYRANNPRATGIFTSDAEVQIWHLPELEQNRLGFELAKAWIVSDLGSFAKLALRKLQHLMGGDGYGAYWGILRASGAADEATSLHNAGPATMKLYELARLASHLFWIVILGLSVRTCFRLWRQPCGSREQFALLFYPIVYCAGVFAVFESGSRQHIFAFASMLVLAAWALAPSPFLTERERANESAAT